MHTIRSRGPIGTPRSASGGRRNLRRRPFSLDDAAVASNVGTVLLVILAVAMVSIVGAFVFGMAQFEKEPPEVGIVMTSDPDRMHAHINDVSESRPISEFRVLARLDNGTMVMYDSDGDAIGDKALALGLDELSIETAAGPLPAPLVYIDADKNDMVSSGDYFTYRHPFFPPLAPMIDVTHGYMIVEMAPNGIPRDTRMLIVACENTLPGANIQPGDVVRITIEKGGVVYHQEEGYASIGSYWTTTFDIPMAWSPATYGQTEFTVRPGEVDEYVLPYPFKVLPENPPTKAEEAYWERLNNPMVDGTDIVLVHIPSNEVVLEFTI